MILRKRPGFVVQSPLESVALDQISSQERLKNLLSKSHLAM